MGSFLNTLAARALGDLPVVRPRQPSRFEPIPVPGLAGFTPDAVDGLSELLEFAVPSDADVPGPDPATTARPPARRRASGASILPPDDAAAPPDRTGPARPLEERPLSAARPLHPPVVPPADRDSRATMETQSASAQDQPAERWFLAGRQSDAAPIEKRVSHLDALARRTISHPTPAIDDAARVASSPTVAGIAATAPLVADPPSEQEVLRPARLASPLELPETRIASASDPTGPPITVTIGRIEVRASRPEPARPVVRAPRPQPRLTLDAFLNREGRGR